MEDSSHEQPFDQPTTESKMNRRDMAKLLGAVTALSASLGATFVTSAASLPQGAQLKLKFFKPSPSGDPARAQLLCTVDVSPEDQRKLAETEGPVELRIVSSLAKQQRGVGAGQVTEIIISSHTMHKAAWQAVKQHADLKND